MTFLNRTVLAACLLAAACTVTSQASPRDRVTGPGALLPDSSGLSPGDTYAEYQWGLKNDGSLQLVEIRSQFADSGGRLRDP